MKPESNSSVADTATTPASAPPASAGPAKPPHPSTEAEYLQQQAALAKAALAGTLASLKNDLGETVDLRLWTKQHPWIMSMAAAAAGFATAAAVVPSKDHHQKKMLESLKEAFHKATHHAKSNSHHERSEKEEDEPHHAGWGETILKELIGAIRPVLVSLVAGLAKPPPPMPQESATTDTTGGPSQAGQP